MKITSGNYARDNSPPSLGAGLFEAEDLYAADTPSLPDNVGEITPDLEGIGSVRAYFVDVADLDGVGAGAPKPTLRSRLGSTFSAVGRGLPYMVGTKKPRRAR